MHIRTCGYTHTCILSFVVVGVVVPMALEMFVVALAVRRNHEVLPDVELQSGGEAGQAVRQLLLLARRHVSSSIVPVDAKRLLRACLSESEDGASSRTPCNDDTSTTPAASILSAT